MKDRRIANFNAIFPIGLGAMPLSIGDNRPSTAKASHIIKTFLEMGGNFIDTADVYGLDDTDRGHNEKLLSQAIKQFDSNNSIIISTKGGATRPNGGWSFRDGGHPQQLQLACESSLKNLNVSAIDLYYLHGPDPHIPFADSLGALIKLQEKGKIKNIGVANVTLEQLKVACSLTTISAVQNRCNPFCKADLQNGLIAFCKSNNISYVPYCPLGGWAEHTKLSTSPLFDYFTKKYGVTSYQLCLAWLINKYDNIIPIPGMDKIDHVAANFHALNIALEQGDSKMIDEFPDLYPAIHIDP